MVSENTMTSYMTLPSTRTKTQVWNCPKPKTATEDAHLSPEGTRRGTHWRLCGGQLDWRTARKVKRCQQQWKIRTHVIWSLRSDLMLTARPSSRTCCCTTRYALRNCLAGRGRRRGRLSSWKAAEFMFFFQLSHSRYPVKLSNFFFFN